MEEGDCDDDICITCSWPEELRSIVVVSEALWSAMVRDRVGTCSSDEKEASSDFEEAVLWAAPSQFATWGTNWSRVSIWTWICKEAKQEHEIYHIEKARSTLLLVEAVLSEKVLLSMASNLCWGPCGHKVAGDASPISLSKFLESNKKRSVFFLGPWHSYEPQRSLNLMNNLEKLSLRMHQLQDEMIVLGNKRYVIKMRCSLQSR